MPRATVAKTTEKFDLTTCEGGWVELRRLSYGEKIAKDAEALRMRLQLDTEMKNIGADLNVVNETVTYLEMSKCIVDHNLTKPNPRDPEEDIPFDFKRLEDIRQLDPRIGDEISGLIGKMNDFDLNRPEADAEGK